MRGVLLGGAFCCHKAFLAPSMALGAWSVLVPLLGPLLEVEVLLPLVLSSRVASRWSSPLGLACLP